MPRQETTPYDGKLTVDFALGDVTAADGKTVYGGLALQEMVEDGRPMVFVFARHCGRMFYTGRDASGRLRFADTPREAPVVHIGGPLSMGLATRDRSTPVRFARGEVTELCASVGTPGRGRGTFLGLRHAHVPEGKPPVAEIAFPHERPGRPAIKVRVVLEGRC